MKRNPKDIVSSLVMSKQDKDDLVELLNGINGGGEEDKEENIIEYTSRRLYDLHQKTVMNNNAYKVYITEESNALDKLIFEEMSNFYNICLDAIKTSKPIHYKYLDGFQDIYINVLFVRNGRTTMGINYTGCLFYINKGNDISGNYLESKLLVYI